MPTANDISIRLKYEILRNVSTPHELANLASTHIVVIKAEEILKIGTEGNLRTYIPQLSEKKRTVVHQQIAQTIGENPDRFSQLNSGCLIGASKIKVDDARHEVTLWDASVNNGAQTQGEIKRYIEQCRDNGDEPNDFYLRAEISVDPDQSWRTEIAIARNTTIRIENVSMAGKRGYFDDLAKSLKHSVPGLTLATSETEISGDSVIDPRQLIQVLFAMMPDQLIPPGRDPTKFRINAYTNSAKSLQNFINIYHSENEEDVNRYNYFCDMAGIAWRTYQFWRRHPDAEGFHFRENAKHVKRDKEGRIVAIADGIIFPILASLSSFVKKDPKGHWKLTPPDVFRDKSLISCARRQLKAHKGPIMMGRSEGAYEALKDCTEMANEYAKAA